MNSDEFYDIIELFIVFCQVIYVVIRSLPASLVSVQVLLHLQI